MNTANLTCEACEKAASNLTLCDTCSRSVCSTCFPDGANQCTDCENQESGEGNLIPIDVQPIPFLNSLNDFDGELSTLPLHEVPESVYGDHLAQSPTMLNIGSTFIVNEVVGYREDRQFPLFLSLTKRSGRFFAMVGTVAECLDGFLNLAERLEITQPTGGTIAKFLKDLSDELDGECLNCLDRDNSDTVISDFIEALEWAAKENYFDDADAWTSAVEELEGIDLDTLAAYYNQRTAIVRYLNGRETNEVEDHLEGIYGEKKLFEGCDSLTDVEERLAWAALDLAKQDAKKIICAWIGNNYDEYFPLSHDDTLSDVIELLDLVKSRTTNEERGQ